MRINKYVASCGVGARRSVEELITQRRIKINDNIVTNLATQVGASDIVKLDDKVIKPVAEKVYIIMNKPRGCLTTCSDNRGRKTVMDLLPTSMRSYRVFPVGRLDYDTEGLLILTNDGDFCTRVIHPSHKIQKTYIADVSVAITNEHITELEKQADGVKKLSNKTIEIVIHEGKNRQVRKMLAAIGLETINLRRISIGKLELDDLKSGEIICHNLPPII